MKNINELLELVKKSFDLSISSSPLKNQIKFPLIISSEYEMKALKIESVEFLALMPKNKEVESIKRIKMVQEKYNQPIIYISQKIATPLKDQLIKERISYLSWDMIYLYPLLCFQDRKIISHKRKKKLSISMQPLLLYMIYNQNKHEVFSIDSLEPFFEQSAATLYRYINALQDLNLIEKLEEVNRKKIFRLNKQLSFEEILSKMQTPIKDIIFIKHDDYERITDGDYHLFAGESALRPYNLIVDTRTFAISYKESKSSQWDRSNYAEVYYEGYDELQQWHYDPKQVVAMIPFSHKSNDEEYIDPISLYLSMKEHDIQDIRVNDSVELLLESIKRKYK